MNNRNIFILVFLSASLGCVTHHPDQEAVRQTVWAMRILETADSLAEFDLHIVRYTAKGHPTHYSEAKESAKEEELSSGTEDIWCGATRIGDLSKRLIKEEQIRDVPLSAGEEIIFLKPFPVTSLWSTNIVGHKSAILRSVTCKIDSENVSLDFAVEYGFVVKVQATILKSELRLIQLRGVFCAVGKDQKVEIIPFSIICALDEWIILVDVRNKTKSSIPIIGDTKMYRELNMQ